jgi:hypothetical protein
MENKNTILSELKEISPAVAEIGFAVPYRVPAGYFEELPGQILARLKGEDEGSLVLQTKDNPYQVPQGYFENFAANLLQRIKATEAETAKDELEALSPLLSGLNKKTPFSTPAGYFEELTDNAIAGAKAIDFVNGELENLSPLMSSLKGKQVYEAPPGYFENLPEQMLQRAKKQPAKTVSMNFTRKVVRYAAAAVVAGLIITAGWFYLGNNSTINDTFPSIENISDADLESFVENEAGISPEETMILANAEMNTEDLQAMFAEVPDEELVSYLEKYSPKDISVTN